MKQYVSPLIVIAVLMCLYMDPSTAGWQCMNPRTGGRFLNDVGGSSLQDVLIVGDDGVIVHWDGGNDWQEMDSGVSKDLYCVWSFSETDSFVGGDDGLIIHWNGVSWQRMDCDCEERIKRLWGSSPNDVWAVSYYSVLHWDGVNWRNICELSGEAGSACFSDIWGIGTDNVYITGHYLMGTPGFLLHWNGIEWQDILDLDDGLTGIWGSAANDIHIVGCDGSTMHFYHWDGVNWEETYSSWEAYPECICGVSAGEVYCGVNLDPVTCILQWDGAGWSMDGTWCFSNINAIANCSAFLMFETKVYQRTDGVWSRIGSVTDEPLTAVWAASPEDAFATGRYGSILHFDGAQWSIMLQGDDTTGYFDIWGVSHDNVFAVGSGILHYDGTAWYSMEIPTTSHIYGIDGIAPDFAFAVGGGYSDEPPVILHWNGANWTETNIQTPNQLNNVCVLARDDAVVVGSSGTIARWNGVEWTLQTSPTNQVLRGVWGSSANNIIAIGWDNTMVLWDGREWQSKLYPGNFSLSQLWGYAPDEVFAVGGNLYSEQVIMQWDGFSWSLMQNEDGGYFQGIGQFDGRQFLAVGYSGSIVRWDGEYPLGVRIGVPREIPDVGDTFAVRGYLDNTGLPIERAEVFFAIGHIPSPSAPMQYWFWPGWMEYDSATGSGLDCRMMSIPYGITRIDVVPEFAWPAEAGLSGDIIFYGAILNPDTGEVIGQTAMAITQFR